MDSAAGVCLPHDYSTTFQRPLPRGGVDSGTGSGHEMNKFTSEFWVYVWGTSGLLGMVITLHVLLKSNYCSPHQPLPKLTLDMPAGSLPLPKNSRKDEDEMARGDGERKIEGEIGKREGQEGRDGRGGEEKGGEGSYLKSSCDKLPRELSR